MIARFALARFWSVSLLAVSACAHDRPYVWVHDLPLESETPTIAARDTISVVVKNQAQVSGDFVVRANGTYVQPLLGEVPVAGLTPDQLAAQLGKLFENILTNPVIAVSISNPHLLRISVLGEVRTPGVVELPQGDGVLAAVARAGGLNDFADRDHVYVLRDRPTRQRIRFRFAELTGGEERAASFKLRDGDIVVVE